MMYISSSLSSIRTHRCLACRAPHFCQENRGSQISLQCRTRSSLILPRGQMAQEVEVKTYLLAEVWEVGQFYRVTRAHNEEEQRATTRLGTYALLQLTWVSRRDGLYQRIDHRLRQFISSLILVANNLWHALMRWLSQLTARFRCRGTSYASRRSCSAPSCQGLLSSGYSLLTAPVVMACSRTQLGINSRLPATPRIRVLLQRTTLSEYGHARAKFASAKQHFQEHSTGGKLFKKTKHVFIYM